MVLLDIHFQHLKIPPLTQWERIPFTELIMDLAVICNPYTSGTGQMVYAFPFYTANFLKSLNDYLLDLSRVSNPHIKEEYLFGHHYATRIASLDSLE